MGTTHQGEDLANLKLKETEEGKFCTGKLTTAHNLVNYPNLFTLGGHVHQPSNFSRGGIQMMQAVNTA